MKDPCITCDDIRERNSFFREHQNQLSEILRDPSINSFLKQVMDVPMSSERKLKLLSEAKQKNDLTHCGKMTPDKRHSELFRTCRDGIAFVDMQGRLLDCNPAYSEMLGYTLDELNKLTYQELTPAKWKDIEKDIVKNQYLKKDYCDYYEKEYIRKDGTIFPVSINGWLIKDDLGKPAGMWAFVRDITNQKKVHDDLKASEQRFRRLSEASFEAIAVHKDGKIIDVNQKFIDMLGYTFDELKHIDGKELIAPQCRETVKNNIASGYEVLYEVMGIKKDGTIFPIEIHAKNSHLDGQSVRIVAIQDLTKRKELERQIVEMAENYKSLYNNALIPLYRTRQSDGKLLECNEKMAELLGYQSKEECLREHYSAKHYADPGQRTKLIELLKEHGKVDGFEIQTREVDGSLLWVKVSAKLNTEGTYIEGMMLNITASKILTESELAVLRLVLQGKTNKEIATELNRSVRTIEEHRSHIMHRMGVNNLVELAKEAVKLGLG